MTDAFLFPQDLRTWLEDLLSFDSVGFASGLDRELFNVVPLALGSSLLWFAAQG
jgi:hypothetical protein